MKDPFFQILIEQLFRLGDYPIDLFLDDQSGNDLLSKESGQ